MNGNAALAATPPVSTVERFDADSTAPALAREATRHFLRNQTGQEETEAATLLVSELVTNSVTASEGLESARLSLSLRVISDNLLIRVIDSAPGIPEASKPDTPQEHGYGLFIVEQLCRHSGYFLMGGGQKCTYCILSISGEETGGSNQ
ncbi:MAG TPA: ATP-binding protein [Trebonia sp.]|jgi:anti-sigma regulatory factor (Ser/Thr protein kinase)